MMARWRLLHHPALLGAAVVLAVNDHALKGSGPPALTGKLSDFAGVLLLTLLACVVARRPIVAAAFVGVAFAVLKIVPGAGAAAAPVLGGTTLRDPTDLVALLALWPAVAIAGRVPVSPAPPWGRRVVGAAVLLACMMTITATSCAEYERDRVLVRGDEIYYVDDGLDSPEAVSADGGRTWDLTPGTPLEPKATDPVDEDCTDDGHCFRTAHGSYVEERRPGGTWSRTFELTDTERRNAELHREGLDYPNPLDLLSFSCGEPDTLFTDAFSGVAVVEVDGTDHAVVTMGRQGVLHKEVGGEWERLPVGANRPAPLTEPAWLTRVKAAAVLCALASLALLAVWWRPRARRSLPGWGIVLALAATVLTFPISLARDPLARTLFLTALALAAACIYALVKTERPSASDVREAQRARVRKWVE